MQTRKTKLPKKKFGQLHVGHNHEKETCRYWALNPPISYPKEPRKNVFADKCLLVSFIFGLLQNLYYFSLKQDKRFLKIQNVNSKVIDLKNSACKLLLNELECLIETTKLQELGPYHLQTTVKILHSTYKCQIFLFDSIANSSKLCYMYPPELNDELQPIYLFKAENDHIIFIRHLKAYFRKNYTICFGCKSKFKQPYNKHLCPKKKSCFSCRRLYLSSENSYYHEKIINIFCDRLISKEIPQICSICNCTLYSKHCAKGHKLLCNGQGRFGYKCIKDCQRFFYCNQNTSADIKKAHSCDVGSFCRHCRQEKELNHLCKLLPVTILPYHSRLCYFKFFFINDNYKIPAMAMMLKECEQRGVFDKFTFVNEALMLNANDSVELGFLKFNYFPKNTKHATYADLLKRRPRKTSEDFTRNVRKLLQRPNFENRLLAFMLQQRFTSFICNDTSSEQLVSIISITVTKF